MKFILLLGRILYGMLFILAGSQHFTKADTDYASQMGLPFFEILVPLAGVIAILGGLSILIGYKARFGAWLLVIFLVPVTFMMHKFWGLSDPALAAMQEIMFMKNLALLGGALIIAYFGSGPWSIDSKPQESK